MAVALLLGSVYDAGRVEVRCDMNRTGEGFIRLRLVAIALLLGVQHELSLELRPSATDRDRKRVQAERLLNVCEQCSIKEVLT